MWGCGGQVCARNRDLACMCERRCTVRCASCVSSAGRTTTSVVGGGGGSARNSNGRRVQIWSGWHASLGARFRRHACSFAGAARPPE
eukprot:4647645-Prymnesium_polylepis.1